MEKSLDVLEQVLEIIYGAALFDNEEPVFSVIKEPIGDADSMPWPPRLEAELWREAEKRRAAGWSFYVSTMTARPSEDPKHARQPYRNSRACFSRLFFAVVDDVGTKVAAPSAEPTMIIETSAGNFQYFYVFSDPIAEIGLAERVAKTIMQLGDAGGRLVNKFARLPIGCRNKLIDGVKDDFPVRLVSADGPKWAWDALLAALGVELIREAPGGGVRTSTGTPAPPEGVVDTVVTQLDAWGMLRGEQADGWLRIQCPNHAQHTHGDDTAGYSPLGVGGIDYQDFRTFKCFHDHCKDFDFFAWYQARAQNDFPPRRYDPLPRLQAQFCLIEHGNLVADMLADARHRVPLRRLGDFKAARTMMYSNEGGRPITVGQAWQNHRRTLRCVGQVYQPGAPAVVELGGERYFNTYRMPVHIAGKAAPDWFLRHIRHVVPDLEQSETLLDWLAWRVQHPERRSWAVVMVADLEHGTEGHTYGIGRSVITAAMRQVLQSGVRAINLDELLGEGSQAQYNEWAAGAQLVVVDEVKEAVPNWRDDVKQYERLKDLIDPAVKRGFRIKEKYGQVNYLDFYGMFLFNTNHSDAIRLPKGDRRFCVLGNSSNRRTDAEYGEVWAAVDDPQKIADLFHFLAARDLSGFDAVYPPSTAEKNQMTYLGATEPEEVWERVLEKLAGDLVTEKQILTLAERVLLEMEIDDAGARAVCKKFAVRAYRRLPMAVPGDKEGSKLYDAENGKRVQFRIVSNVQKWREAHLDGARKMQLAEIAKNSPGLAVVR